MVPDRSRHWHRRHGRRARCGNAPGIAQPATGSTTPALTSSLLLNGEPTLGRDSAPITIVEFSDFECTYCRRFHKQVFPKLKSQYIDTGLVRFVHKDLPLPFHRHALPAAAAARCAGEQNRYWEMYAALFDQQNCLGCKGVLAIAAEERLDTTAMQGCMERKATVAVINSNRSEACCTTSVPHQRLSSDPPKATAASMGV